MRLESDIIEKRHSSSAHERIGLPPSDNTRPHPGTQRFYKVDEGTGISQEITLQTKKPVTSTISIRAKVASTNNNLEANRTPELDPKMTRLWALYQTARVEYTSCPKGSVAHSKAARFLRDTIENGLTYIERAYHSVVCDGNKKVFPRANLLGVWDKFMELRTSLNEVTPVVAKAYGGQRRRFGSELFQPEAQTTEDKQRVSFRQRDRDMDTDRASEFYHGAQLELAPRDGEAMTETIRESRRSRSPPRPRPLARPRLRSRSRSPPSSRFPPRVRSPLSSPGLYYNGHATGRNVREFSLDGGPWRRGPPAQYASFPQENDRYRPTY